MPPADQVQALNDPSLHAVVLLTAEVKVNTSATVELSKRIHQLELALSGEGENAGLKTKVFLLEQTIQGMKKTQDEYRQFKINFYVGLLLWLLSIIYNIVTAGHKP